MRLAFALIAAVLQTAIAQIVAVSPAGAQAQPAQPHNVVLFIADGLRFRMVDDHIAPTMAAIARDGVSLRNGHALFPTFTMANASGMATGHLLGDTGTFSNTIYTGFEVPGAGNSLTPFLENDVVLGDVDEHFAGNYLDKLTILKLARDKGYSTASVGKIGPALVFDPTERSGEHDVQRTQQTLSACVLVTRSGRHATQPGRQLEYTDARHQRPNLARRDPTTTWRASVRRSLSSACSRRPTSS